MGDHAGILGAVVFLFLFMDYFKCKPIFFFFFFCSRFEANKFCKSINLSFVVNLGLPSLLKAYLVSLKSTLLLLAVTPCAIWPQKDVRVRFSYLEEEGGAVKEAEGLHLGLLSSRDGCRVG